MPTHLPGQKKRVRKLRGGGLTSRKAKKILKDDGSLSGKQKGFFGLIAGGGKPTRLKKRQKGGAVNARGGGLIIMIGDKPPKSAGGGRRGKK